MADEALHEATDATAGVVVTVRAIVAVGLVVVGLVRPVVVRPVSMLCHLASFGAPRVVRSGEPTPK
jgi:hypothetical protein